ncbi:Serine protease [Botrimarina colliarenosi]|uniref:Serine protease n=1 Tax=Botrimarina colliarenosi TaxID=2528001 RepID=A0A5C6AKY9_9BACT|nr:serine protease [Botrimarina colliarenosi]TWT99691.1 Serine protease [Botrimarina colliarenosi]
MSGLAVRIASLLLSVFITAPAAAALFQATPSAPHPAVCRVAVVERDGMAFGSGTLIDAREQYGLVVTNWHVVRDAKGKIEVRFPGGFTSEARPLKLDETWDLAALVVWRPPTEPAPLAQRPPQPGETLTICGYGQGDYLQQTGRCTDYYSPEVGQPQELVELNVQARQGDSGGPIFNERGELAGVLFGAARGTTLGSFGGRVQTFLASLAPDIGAAKGASTLIAQTPRPTPQHDPFLAAERSTPPEASRPLSPVSPPPSLTDRSAAPVLASSRPPTRHSADSWRSAEAWQPADRPATGATPVAAPIASVGFSPQVSLPAAPGTDSVDWYDDGRTLLALVGVAALVVTGLRALG